jgi:Glycosyl transferase 4-like domain
VRSSDDVVFVAWTSRPGRCHELSAAVGGRPEVIFPLAIRRRALVPLRYLLSVPVMLASLLRRRPSVTVVQNPPVIPACVAWLYARLSGGQFVLDSHTSSFGEKGNIVARALLPVHRWLARRARAVLVACDPLGDEVASWGGQPLVVHEAPSSEPSPPLACDQGFTALVVTIFSPDEPVETVAAAARALPEVSFRVTGDPARAPEALRREPSANLTLTGYLERAEYERALREAHVVVVLTTDELSIVRAGYEAVYAQRPLILSATPLLRETFPYAIHVENAAVDLVRGVRDALSGYDGLAAETGPARAHQLRRWDEQRSALLAVVGR